jgi:hypothetical protein
MIEDSPRFRLGVPEVADVVHTDIPLESRPLEGVRESAGGVVSLENEHSLLGMFGKQNRRRQSADAGTDDDGIVALVETDLTV